MNRKVSNLDDAIAALQRSRDATSTVVLVVCMADKMSTLGVDGVITHLSRNRIVVRGETGQFALALDGADFGPNDKSWSALEDCRLDLRRAPVTGEAVLPSGDVFGAGLPPRS